MQEETDFLKKMQSVYAAQSADAKRALNSLLFEYEPTLAQFPALRQETQRAIDKAADLDIAALADRLRPALEMASLLAVEIDTLDEAMRHHADMDKLITLAQTRLTAASASVYAAKMKALTEKLAQPPVIQAAPVPEPVTDDYAPGTEFKDGDGCPVMVVVPAGNFMMGSPANEKDRKDNEGPQHSVTIRCAFAVGKYPITVEEWAIFIQATGYEWNESPGFPQTLRDPVVNVSWYDAQAYVQWLSDKTGKHYRLLSEAEWEYAARAGTQTPYPFPAYLPFAKCANSDGTACGYEYTSPVGSFPANRFGLYDMAGNVWEWVQDNWHDDYKGAPNDGAVWAGGNGEYRVLRGGSWGLGPQDLRSADRNDGYPTNRIDFVGFRVARTVP